MRQKVDRLGGRSCECVLQKGSELDFEDHSGKRCFGTDQQRVWDHRLVVSSLLELLWW